MTEEKTEVADEAANITPEQNQAVLKKMEEATAKLDAANKQFAANEELLKARKVEETMAGKAAAGDKEKKKEETPKEYSERVMRNEL